MNIDVKPKSSEVSQTAFRTAMLDPSTPAPEGLVNPDGLQAEKRFDVYRNNVAHSLATALAEGFPVLVKLLGEEFFRQMALVYLRIHPPSSQMMMHYGAAIPQFLVGFPGTVHLKYLPDVAKLELALRRAYHAGDSEAIDPVKLTALSQADLMDARLTLAPAVEILRSDFPALSIWEYNMQDGPSPVMSPEDILISRKGFDPIAQRLPMGGATFVEALLKGSTFGTALGLATSEVADFDLTITLGALFAGHAIIKIDRG
ncbi:DNA-binding domain-containing protein [Aliiroseovarius sp. KMU-50]|uniref:DNA-binding domain-containing protein n=1 Tax=Aliiroseovarius salicola TaxID=3009082 RepID=A0ABT4W177_9RHOB|nr:DNA-binding domain-containing protein [Aliiroseovarius sp. KMU-50]MDA5094268.1 DNA-binding domain-containing protein [Aliiroseovarius sp. KMU-50]